MRKKSDEEWEKTAGPLCPSCGEETLRLIDRKCPQCYLAMIAAGEVQMEDRAERRHVRRLLQEGTISLQDLREGRY